MLEWNYTCDSVRVQMDVGPMETHLIWLQVNQYSNIHKRQLLLYLETEEMGHKCFVNGEAEGNTRK